MKKTLAMLPWGDRVTVYLVERDMPSQSHEGTGEEYRREINLKVMPLMANKSSESSESFLRSYIDKPASLGRKFHLIIGDRNFVR